MPVESLLATVSKRNIKNWPMEAIKYPPTFVISTVPDCNG